jgi:hypothetical protein
MDFAQNFIQHSYTYYITGFHCIIFFAPNLFLNVLNESCFAATNYFPKSKDTRARTVIEQDLYGYYNS